MIFSLASALEAQLRTVKSFPGWTAAPALRGDSNDSGSPTQATACYQFGDAVVQVGVNDPALLDPFSRFYGECAVSPVAMPQPPRVRCVVRRGDSPSTIEIRFLEGAPSDPASSALGLLHPPRGASPYSVQPATPEGWRLVGGEQPVVAVSGTRVIIDCQRVPEDFLAEYLVSATLETQPDLMVVHAAALQVRDAGILLAGPSRAGKTTTSVHLAARGHALLGDEMAVIRISAGEVLPLRRSVSLRSGPRAPELSALLERLAVTEADVPGGKSEPIRIDRMFPDSQARASHLGGAFFLSDFSTRPAVAPFRLSINDANVFEYLAANDIALVSWGLTPARRTLRLLALKHLLTQLPCWRLTVGSPAETAELIERTMEER